MIRTCVGHHRVLSGQILWLLPLMILGTATATQAQLRVVSYNTTGPPDASVNIVLRAIGEETRNGIAKPIDVLLLQEQETTSGLPDAQAFVNLLNSMYTGQTSLGLPVTYARGSLVGFGDTTQSIVYRTQTVDLQGETSVGVSGGVNPQPRAAIRHQLRFDGYTASDATLYVYNSHYKAGDEENDPDNLLRRNTEAIAIRTNSNALGSAHALYTGDHNFYTAGEPAFQTLIAAGNGQAEDPLGLTAFDNDSGTFLSGEWHNNFSSAFSHTQSPCASSQGNCGVPGGMDDRFDFQLMTSEMRDGEGLDYIPDSYHAFGNGGNICCNNSINLATNSVTFPGVTSYTKTQILNALSTATDHIPVVADYQLPAMMKAVAGAIPSTLQLDQLFQLGVTVSNSAKVVATNGADELDYFVSATGAVTAPGNPPNGFSDLANDTDVVQNGLTHLFAFDTSTPGMKTGTITLMSASQMVQSGLINIPISYLVVLAGDYNQNGVVDAADYALWRNTFGQNVANGTGADGSGNGLVDDADYGIWTMHFGQSAGSGAGASFGLPGSAVPEPGSCALLLVGVCLARLTGGTLRGWTRKN